MRTAQKIITEIDEIIGQDEWTKGDILLVMTNFRLILELFKIKNEFEYLNLFSNWVLHTKLSKSKTGYKIFEFFTDVMINSLDGTKEFNYVGDTVIEAISLHKLKEDIENLGRGWKIPSITKFMNLENWKLFAFKLIEILYDRPLSYPVPLTKSAQPSYDSIKLKTDATPHKDKLFPIELIFRSPEHNRFNNDNQIMGLKTLFGTQIYFELIFIDQLMVDNKKKNQL